MAGPSESSNVITNTERQTEGTTETDIKKTAGDDNVVAVASGGDDDNVAGGDNDDDSSDEDTSYCKYCKRSFTSSVVSKEIFCFISSPEPLGSQGELIGWP